MCINSIQIPLDKTTNKLSRINLIGRLVSMSHQCHSHVSSCLFLLCPLPKKVAKTSWQEVTPTILTQRKRANIKVSSLSGLILSFLCRLSFLRLGSISPIIPCALSIHPSSVNPPKWCFKESLPMSSIKRLKFIPLWDGQQSKKWQWLS